MVILSKYQQLSLKVKLLMMVNKAVNFHVFAIKKSNILFIGILYFLTKIHL